MSDDVATQIARYIDEACVPVTAAEVMAVEPWRPTPRRARLVLVAAVAVVLAIVAAALLARRDAGDPFVGEPEIDSRPLIERMAGRSWEALPRFDAAGPPPAGNVRADLAVGWSGSALVVAARTDDGSGGLVVAQHLPAQDRWVGANVALGAARHRAVWAGDRLLLIVGQELYELLPQRMSGEASGSPGSGSVRLASAPAPLAGDIAWAGAGLVVMPDRTSADRRPLVYDRATDSWRVGAAPPAEYTGDYSWDGCCEAGVTWTGREAVVFTGNQLIEPGRAGARPWAYDPRTDTWRTLPIVPVGGGLGITSAIAVDDGLLVIDSLGRAYRSDASGQWRTVAPFAETDMLVGPRLTRIGGSIVAAALGRVRVYDEVGDRWVDGPPIGHRTSGYELVMGDGVLYAVGVDGEASRLVIDAPTSPSPSTPARSFAARVADGRWRGIDAPDLVGRSVSMAAWTGNELVVLSGPQEERDGAPGVSRLHAYAPSSTRWRSYDVPGDASVTAVWTGREVLVLGGTTMTAFDVASGRFRSMPAPPGPPGAAVWTGGEIVTRMRGDAAETRLMIFDVRTERWRWSTPAPSGWLAAGRGPMATDGRAVYLLGQQPEWPQVPTPVVHDLVLDSWRALALPPPEARTDDWGMALLPDGDLVGVTFLGRALRFDEQSGWRAVEPLVTPEARLYPRMLLGTEGTIIAITPDRLRILDPRTDRWSDGPLLPVGGGIQLLVRGDDGLWMVSRTTGEVHHLRISDR